MNVRKTLAFVFAAAVLVVPTGGLMAAYDFVKAWEDVDLAQKKNLPRTVTNKVEEIVREATKAERWPDAARAFLVREAAMRTFTDEQTADWLPAFAASVDAQPAPIQAVLQLHLAHTYLDASPSRRIGAAPTKLDDGAASDKMPPWSPEKIASTLEAQFAKVFAHADELKEQKLADWTALFDPGTYPASYCPTLFDFAVRDAVAFYGMTIPDKTLEKGSALYRALIDFHKADGNLDARAMAEMGLVEHLCEFAEAPGKARGEALLKALGDLIAEYDGKTEVVALAAAKKARLLDLRGEKAAAHDLAAAHAAKWPASPGGRMCANIVADIERMALGVDVERNWCAPWPEITVSAKNLDEVHFRLVAVSFDDLVADFSMGERASDVNARPALRDKYLKRAPAKEWVERLDLKPGYAVQKFAFPAPSDLKAGHYVLYAAANDKFGADKMPLFAQYVTVTSLALVLNTGNGEFRGTVYRAESGEPVAGAKVELWGYPKKGGQRQVKLEEYLTDAKGDFAAVVAKKDVYNAFARSVRVVFGGDEVLSLGTMGSGSLSDDELPVEFIDLFTDRALYRPGQEIKVKGIAYHADPLARDFRTQTDVTVRLTLKDPNGKEVATARLRPNKWGSFTHAFTAPADRLAGTYRIDAWYLLADGRRGRGYKSVNVEEYKRPKFSVKFDGAPEKATLGEPVTIVGRALTYSGLPVQRATVEWGVERTTHYSSWWRWLRDATDDDDGEDFVAKGEAETDEDGVFKVTFTPVASPTADLSGEPSFDFAVTATVTDETGEARTAAESFEIGTVQCRARVRAEGEWQTPERPVPVHVSVESLTGAPLPVKGTLRAFRLVQPEKPVRKPANRSRYGSGRDDAGPWNWQRWEVGEEILSREIAGEKAERTTLGLPLGAGAYRLVFETKDTNGKTARDCANVCVFDPKAKHPGLAVPSLFRVEKTTVKVGETLRAFWGTGYKTGFVRVRVVNNRKTLLEQTVGGESPGWFFELPVGDENRGEFRIETIFVRENRIYCEGATVDVPWDNKRLEIKTEHLTSKLSPGKEETWTFKVSGPAEVLAFMYDRSLDAYTWHEVSPGFSSHFTPWTRYRAWPNLANMVMGLYCLDGTFPTSHRMCSFARPSWRVVEWRPPVVLRKRGVGSFRMAAAAACSSAELDMDGCEAEVADAAGICYEDDCDDIAWGDKKADASSGDGPDVSPRRKLNETAFFFPDLETDADGNVSLTFTAPDALTGWKLLMVAHDNELRGGVLRNDKIVTTKPLMCEPNPPRFVREGDDFLFAVKVTNTEDDSVGVEVSLGLEGLNGEELFEPDPPKDLGLAPHESKTVEFRVSIPDGCPYLTYVAKATARTSPVVPMAVCGTPSPATTIIPEKTFTDGEEGVLPVLPRRILVREAVQLNVRGGATKSFRFDNLLASGGSGTIRHQDLTVRAVSRPAWYAVLSLPYLMEFPHECCEQMFGRYYANALGAFIANADPRIREMFDAWKAAGGEALKSPLETDAHLKALALEATPWVREAEHETAARARLGDLFDKDKLDGEQARCLVKLRAARNGDGLWPWFPGGPSSSGITLYILTGFARLNHLAGTAWPDFFADALHALDGIVSKDVKERLRLEKEEKIPFRVSGFDVRWMYLHSFAGVAAPKDKAPEREFVKRLGAEWPELGLESQALAAIAMKRRGEVELAKEIMASVKERGVLSEELGMYWKSPRLFSSSVFAAGVSTQALVVEAFREATGDEACAEACNVWLLKQKQTQDWTTTAATADAVYALLLGGGADLLAGDNLAEVTLGGEKVPAGDAEAGTGMWSHRYAGTEVKPEMGEIAFTGAGEKGVAWGGVHWSYFEDVLKVRAHEPRELRVEKKYYRKTKGAEGTRLAAFGEALEPGDEIVARLEITSDRTYEFVHLKDERPACAEPVDVLSRYRRQDGVGYYQSTKDAATHYYIDRLNKGVFVLETSYRVQQKGVFSGGLATLQCMYAPEFTAHSSAETMRVEGRPPARGPRTKDSKDE
ncbi:MAG: hypothetical protein IJ829_02250 [Kiritimatiellae bacterium]|nr:hypothetical protein [Kiritimatiellia bacterium]